MPRPYKKQPFKVALLVLMLIMVAVTGSYMLYNPPGSQTDSDPTVSAAGEAGWQTYAMHADHLSFKYPARWSVSETGADSTTGTSVTYIYSPDNSTTISITSNAALTGAHAAGQILDSRPAHLFGKAYAWNYIKAPVPNSSETGSSPGETVTANLMTNATADATWPSVPSVAPGEGVSIIIHNFSATTTASQLQKIADVTTARSIAESLSIATQKN